MNHPHGPGIQRSVAEAMLRAMHEHVSGEEPVSRIEAMIHPQAEMRLLVSFGRLLDGRDAIVDALENGRQALIYRARVISFEWLDDCTSFTTGQARYALEDGGFSVGKVFWLDELRDGLIWRVHLFRREADARRAYEEEFEQRSAAD